VPPSIVSHFELLEKIGEGGMGAVYKARDLKLPRVVALKFLSPSRIGSAEEQDRLRQEANALSTLNHPHVATVYEVDELDGQPFLALEFLPGGTMQGRIRQSGARIPAASVITWAACLAEGLAHAHRHGIVHRDVKSSNVLFDAEGRVKLADFGLATTTRQGTDPAGYRIEGTIGYLPPEQLQGAPPDPRGDLFSFGVLL
jgi:serine/threonine protein kinase